MIAVFEEFTCAWEVPPSTSIRSTVDLLSSFQLPDISDLLSPNKFPNYSCSTVPHEYRSGSHHHQNYFSITEFSFAWAQIESIKSHSIWIHWNIRVSTNWVDYCWGSAHVKIDLNSLVHSRVWASNPSSTNSTRHERRCGRADLLAFGRHKPTVFVATPVVSGGGVWVQEGGTVYAKLPGTSSPALAVDMQVQGGTYDSEPSDGLTIDDWETFQARENLPLYLYHRQWSWNYIEDLNKNRNQPGPLLHVRP
jgi:hypothetical protein